MKKEIAYFQVYWRFSTHQTDKIFEVEFFQLDDDEVQ
jgi:hypothetical protein